MLAIKAKSREAGKKLEELRATGEMPAVFYGAGKESTPISVSMVDFKKIWKEAGESSAVKINTPGGDIDVLIHEVQTDPVTDEPRHADFLVIDMNKKIEVEVPLEFIGISGAVKNNIGNLVKVLHEVEIEALPKDLPHSLSVDITPLENIKDTITVGQIKLPAGVTMITDPKEIVVAITEQHEEKEEEPAPDLADIEVEKKGKQEEEGAEGGEKDAKDSSVEEKK